MHIIVYISNYKALLEGECCPHCVKDPCLDNNFACEVRRTCLDSSSVSRLSVAIWTNAGSPCTVWKCKNGKVCSSVNLECLQITEVLKIDLSQEKHGQNDHHDEE
ncbi:hypothetical protein H1C71_025936 [Ictidomys tridecemlineatus]|nr:hypothetical protein H1C71_025936 [Ictidomys tridecemlineatus]KAG3289617.1 hypothetical protein H1C71_025936 [Ictidomys tridecemlineatus]